VFSSEPLEPQLRLRRVDQADAETLKQTLWKRQCVSQVGCCSRTPKSCALGLTVGVMDKLTCCL